MFPSNKQTIKPCFNEQQNLFGISGIWFFDNALCIIKCVLTVKRQIDGKHKDKQTQNIKKFKTLFLFMITFVFYILFTFYYYITSKFSKRYPKTSWTKNSSRLALCANSLQNFWDIERIESFTYRGDTKNIFYKKKLFYFISMKKNIFIFIKSFGRILFFIKFQE